MADQERPHVFDNPKNVKRVIYAIYVASAISVILEYSLSDSCHWFWINFRLSHNGSI